MYDMTFTNDVTESVAIETIFNACRANEKRESVQDGKFVTSFDLMANGDYQAVLRMDGVIVAIGKVDTFDC